MVLPAISSTKHCIMKLLLRFPHSKSIIGGVYNDVSQSLFLSTLLKVSNGHTAGHVKRRLKGTVRSASVSLHRTSYSASERVSECASKISEPSLRRAAFAAPPAHGICTLDSSGGRGESPARASASGAERARAEWQCACLIACLSLTLRSPYVGCGEGSLQSPLL